MDKAPLAAAIQDNAIANAEWDICECAPFIPDALRELNNVVPLPHLGTSSVLEVRKSMGKMAFADLVAHFEGAAPSQAV